MEKAGLSAARIEILADMCKVMGDPTRLQILLGCLDKPQSVGEIALNLGISDALASHHLRNLKAARLVRGERRGQRVFYTAADAHVRNFVLDMCAHVKEVRHDV